MVEAAANLNPSYPLDVNSAFNFFITADNCCQHPSYVSVHRSYSWNNVELEEEELEDEEEEFEEEEEEEEEPEGTKRCESSIGPPLLSSLIALA